MYENHVICNIKNIHSIQIIIMIKWKYFDDQKGYLLDPFREIGKKFSAFMMLNLNVEKEPY